MLCHALSFSMPQRATGEHMACGAAEAFDLFQMGRWEA
jgi:hypothetical protein